jgi:adenylate kinase
MPVFLMIGPQGSGKGTQADLLSKRLGIPHVGMGSLFRQEIATGSELGKQLAVILESGDLVPADVVDKVLERRLKNDDAKQGVIFDGFPRNMDQVTALDAILATLGMSLGRVIYLNISDKEALKRLAGRRVCVNTACGLNYHVDYRPPKVADTCDHCGSRLQRRQDDNPNIIEHRLFVYHSETARLIDFYKQFDLLWEVDGERSIEQVAEDVYRAATFK